jgi:putative endonuclease
VSHFVYIVRCADGSLYTGYAGDPRARVKIHNLGKGARYTASRRPVRLVYKEACESKGQALSREYAIKRLSREQKKALIRQKATTVTPALRGSRRKARTDGIAASRR